MRLTEEKLDVVLAEALFDGGKFSEWFFHQTRFGSESAKCVFCRSDSPWSRVRLEVANPLTGEMEAIARDCETDVLAVYETPDGRRLALHIENKVVGGSFTPDQPELYRERLQQWRNREKLGRYSDATSVLVAPISFYEKYSRMRRSSSAMCRTRSFLPSSQCSDGHPVPASNPSIERASQTPLRALCAAHHVEC
jgi:hypothetical protein